MSRIKLVVTDFDGVLTDNRVYVHHNGMESVCCHKADGTAIELFEQHGIGTVIVTRDPMPACAQRRAEKLRVPFLHVARKTTKFQVVSDYINGIHLSWGDVAYFGNDGHDAECLRHAGVGVVPCDTLLITSPALTNRLKLPAPPGKTEAVDIHIATVPGGAGVLWAMAQVVLGGR
jgi:3-deoxy-D-manno-octulosonate 8-phosphate phosphatase KdsC-like HAD superfamily phosphatase